MLFQPFNIFNDEPQRETHYLSKRLFVACLLGLILLATPVRVWGDSTPEPIAPRPHIIVFLADDLGWGDVGYHGSRIGTPAIDSLASEGTRLSRFYVMPVCSPTRGALLTGRYPIRLGLQCGVVRPWATHGLPTDEV